MRPTIAAKIFAITLALLVLMASVVAFGVRLFGQVTNQLEDVVHDYLPIYGAVARADEHSLMQGLTLRRMIIGDLRGRADAVTAVDPATTERLREAMRQHGTDVLAELDAARKLIARRLAEQNRFENMVEVAKLDVRIENAMDLQHEYTARWTTVLQHLEAGDAAGFDRGLTEVDRLRDRMNALLAHIHEDIDGVTKAATGEVLSRQRTVEVISILAMAAALLIGMAFSALVTRGLVRPVYQLLDSTQAVQQGHLDTVVKVTSRDEIGRLGDAFNLMIADLRVKERIKETFGRYVDPRIVAGLIDRPDLAKTEGERRTMTILFCDMKGFTSLSEGLTPAALVRLINAYLTDLSVPIRERGGIIDKYIGDAVMAYWGPPFNLHEEQARLACLAALDQLEQLAGFRKRVPEIVGVKRGLPDIDIRVGIATGDVVVGNIGSDVSMNYTVMGDTVNLASRLEGAGKVYGTRTLIAEETWRMAGDAIEVREIDQLLVVGKTEPQRIFELLGRAGQVDPARLELAKGFAAALERYRARDFAAAEQQFAALLAAHPGDTPSKVYLARAQRLRAEPPAEDWDGVWRLTEK
jgi:class 3 adenylate cyclase